MFVEAFLLKTLGTSILKAAVAKAGFKTLVAAVGTAFDVFTVFNTLHTVNTAKDIGVIGLQIGYGQLSDQAVWYLADQIGQDRYEIQRRESGLYLAKTRLVREPIFLANYSEFQAFAPTGFNHVKIAHKSDHRVSNYSAGTHLKAHKALEVRRDHRKR